MSYRLFHTGPASALFGASPLIKAHDATLLADAASLLEHAQAIRQGAEAEREAAVVEGREQGRAEVLAERSAFVAEQFAPIIEGIARKQERLREDLARLALTAVGRMLAELPADVLVTALARKAVDTLPLDTVERIAVAPGVAPEVAARLPAPLAELVVADPALGSDACVLHARSGRVIASLDLQLARLAERWGVDPA